MSVFLNSYVQTGLAVANSLSVNPVRTDYIIDRLVSPKILNFRQITVYDEPATLMNDNLTWKTTYANWNPTFPLVVRKNSAVLPNNEIFNVNNILGTLNYATIAVGDSCNITYNFDWFSVAVLNGMILEALELINTNSFGSSTEYDLNTAPNNWDAVIANLVEASCYEKLILDRNLWSGKLIFSTSLQQTADGSDDIVSTLQDLKQSAIERANKSMENERFKVPYALARPTPAYYRAIRGGGMSGGSNGNISYGKFRGIRINKYI